MFFFPEKKKISEIEKKFNNKLVLAWKDTHWFNDEITADYLQKLYGGLKFFGEQGRSLIVWDSYRAHISDSTKKCSSNFIWTLPWCLVELQDFFNVLM